MKTAVVLFNLGGPDNPEAVEPFLFNLFHDPAIISVPQPFRWMLAKLISRRRAPIAREIYENIGGKSPLLELTAEQAKALEKQCPDLGEVKVFISMRYWHPMSDETAKEVKRFDPDKVILLPLYPQYSTTTSVSSIKDWHRAAGAVGLTAPSIEICCFPEADGWIDAQVSLVRNALGAAGKEAKPRILFSAHGLPKKVITAGDPYQWQVEQTTNAVVERLGIDGLDWVVCYQSQVGPLEWIGPSTDDEIKRAGKDGVPVIVVPIAFVSEHSETLVELDIEYRELAEEHGVPGYARVPAVGTHPSFVSAMSALVRKAVHADGPRISGADGRICPNSCVKCAWA
ncbi:MAG: ferrochelatase [Rhodospirillales bacterium]|nr:ferrochelatase [Rhodospirillales bacterium]MBO6787627.1 ferrochelatase [Rhodospirillales bacterium]